MKAKGIISGILGFSLLAGSPAVLKAQDASAETKQSTSDSTISLTGKQKVSFDKLPAGVQRAVRSQAGSSSIASVNKGTWTGTAYQAGYIKDGKRVALQIAPDGTILNNNANHLVKTPLSNVKSVNYGELPAPVQNTLSQQAGAEAISNIDQGTWHGTLYEADLKTAGKAPILVAEDGSLLKRGELSEAAGAATPGSSKVAFKDLPWTVQKSMLDSSGYAAFQSVNKMTLPDGRTAYRGTYQKDNQDHQITVDQTGAVVENSGGAAGK